MKRVFEKYDGRPSVNNPYTDQDELFVGLVREHGPGYAEELLRQDAALRAAAEQVKTKVRQSDPDQLELSF